MSEPYEDHDPLALGWDRPRWTNRLTWVLVAAVVAALAFSGAPRTDDGNRPATPL